MALVFEPLTLSRQADYLDRLAKCPQKTSDYSFANIWGWAEEYGLEWSWGRTHVWIRQTRPETVYWAPVGPWGEPDWKNCPYLKQIEFMTRVPLELAALWRGQLGPRVFVEKARGHWDYVYSVPELVELKGNRFHRKKNLLNQFIKKYEYTYDPLTPDCVEQVLEMQEEWFGWRESDSSPALLAENRAIFRVLKSWDVISGLFGAGVRVEGEMVAYTVAERLAEDMLVIHFEKGKPGYKGVYQAVNQMFLENSAREYRFVNREQDLDDEGLRKAKLSYLPARFQKKGIVRLRNA